MSPVFSQHPFFDLYGQTVVLYGQTVVNSLLFCLLFAPHLAPLLPFHADVGGFCTCSRPGFLRHVLRAAQREGHQESAVCTKDRIVRVSELVEC